MKQKIIQIGSSIGVVIPKPLAEEKGYKVGGSINLHTEQDSNVIRIEPAEIKKESAVDPAILTWTNEFIDKNRELLKRLADK